MGNEESYMRGCDALGEALVRAEETKQFIKNIKRLTRRKFTAEEKIRISEKAVDTHGHSPWHFAVQAPLELQTWLLEPLRTLK